MTRPRSVLLGVALLGLGVSAAPANAAPAAPAKPLPTLGVLVAKTFLQAVVARDLRTAKPLCAAEVDFDGRYAKGEKAVTRHLKQLLKRLGQRKRLRKIVVMTLAQARARFGPPPARLTLPKGKTLLVGFGRFRRGGLVVFLAPAEGDRWRVVALHD